MDNVNTNDIKELENTDLIICYEKIEEYLKYLNDSILTLEEEE